MFKMLSKAVFSNFSDSWTSEIAVSFIKTGTHVKTITFCRLVVVNGSLFWKQCCEE